MDTAAQQMYQQDIPANHKARLVQQTMSIERQDKNLLFKKAQSTKKVKELTAKQEAFQSWQKDIEGLLIEGTAMHLNFHNPVSSFFRHYNEGNSKKAQKAAVEIRKAFEHISKAESTAANSFNAELSIMGNFLHYLSNKGFRNVRPTIREKHQKQKHKHSWTNTLHSFEGAFA